MDVAIQIIVGGLALGAVYALVGLSFNVVVVTNGVVNFAQGDIGMVAVLCTLGAHDTLALPLGLAVVAGLAAAAIVAVVVDAVAVRPLSGTTGMSGYGWLVSTLGAAIVLQNLAGMIFGTSSQSFPTLLPAGDVTLLGVTVRAEQLSAIALVALLVALFGWIVTRTQPGRILRAMADNRELVGSFGVRTGLARTVVMLVSGVLVGIAALLVAPQTFANPFIGTDLLLAGFVAIVVGGLGNIPGGLIAGLALGLIDALTGRYMPPVWQPYIPFIVLILWITIRGAGGGGLGALLAPLRRGRPSTAVGR